MNSRTRLVIGLAFTHALLGGLGYVSGLKHSQDRVAASPGAPASSESSGEIRTGKPSSVSGFTAGSHGTSAAATDRSPRGLGERTAGRIEEFGRLDVASVLRSLKDLETVSVGPDRLISRQLLIARFAELDPETALSYAASLEGTEKDLGTLTVMSTWVEQDPAIAADHFQSNLDDFGILDAGQRDAAGLIASEWADRDPGAALDWASGLPEEVRGEAYAGIVTRIGEQNSALAIEVIEAMEPGYERAAVSEALAGQWASTRPEETAEWVSNIANPGEQGRAVTGLIETWMKADPQAASEWVDGIEAGPVRDEAIVSMNQSSAFRRHPDLAAVWTSTIQDEDRRTDALETALRRWSAKDPTAAQAWWETQGGQD